MPKVATQIRLDEEVYGKLKYISKIKCRTLNAQMEYYIRLGIAEYERTHGKITASDIAALEGGGAAG